MIPAGKPMGTRNREQGLTLVELGVTLAVAVILLAVAVPSFTTIIKNNRRTGQANDLVASLHFARSEAAKRGGSVTLCKSSNSTSADAPATPVPSCNSSANWEDGWIIFFDENNSGTRDTNEILLKGVGPLSGENTLRGNGNIANSLRYAASGATNNNGTFRLCDSRGATEARSIVISIAGRPRMDSGAAECP